MKTKSLKYAVFLPATALSTMYSINNQMEQILKLRNASGTLSRSAQFQNTAGVYASNLADYGCWCFPGAGQYARGEPVDDFDSACKLLHEGYECARLDGIERGEACASNEINYSYDSSISLTVEEIQLGCENSNVGNQCAIDACKVERWFVATWDSIIMPNLPIQYFGVAPDWPSYKHAAYDATTYTFDPEVTCGVASGNGNGGGTRECCGYYPTRQPFKTQSGARACCGSKTYSIVVNVCCADDDVRSSIDDCN